jgi:hypothetical protein
MVQAVHAAHEAGRRLAKARSPPDHVVVCHVDSEADILKAGRWLEARGIRTVVFREPDLAGQATALATEALVGPARKALASYRLWNCG